MKELQDGYNVCSMCRFRKAHILAVEAAPKTWWSAARTEHLRITCMACEHVVLVKPGTVEVTGLYIGVGT